MKNRQALLTIHRWLGLALALLLVVQGGTGIAMVFRDEIEPVLHSELRVAPGPVRLSMQRLFDTVEAAHPASSLARAEIPPSADQAVLFNGGEARVGKEGVRPRISQG